MPAYHPEGLRVFLSYSRKDESEVQKLFGRLEEDRFSPWLDTNALRSGVDWQTAIEQGMKHADAVLVCLSPAVNMRTGYVSKEIKLALELAQARAKGSVFVIPVKMAPCDLPKGLASLQFADWLAPGGYEKLADDLREHLMEVRPAATIPAWDRVLARNPNDTMALVKRAMALGSAGDRTKAIESLDLALKIDSKFTPAWAEKAKAYEAWASESNWGMRKLRAGTAIQYWDQAIENEPGNPELLVQRGRCFFELLDSAGQALTDYDRALEIEPAFGEAWIARGLIFNQQRQHQAAISDFTRAISLEGEDPTPYLWPGHSYSELKQNIEALADLDKAILLDPNGSYAYRYRADVHKRLGNAGEAQSDLAAAKRLGYDG
jgi:tetratricopeptide (TPR) repeat protein